MHLCIWIRFRLQQRLPEDPSQDANTKYHVKEEKESEHHISLDCPRFELKLGTAWFTKLHSTYVVYPRHNISGVVFCVICTTGDPHTHRHVDETWNEDWNKMKYRHSVAVTQSLYSYLNKLHVLKWFRLLGNGRVPVEYTFGPQTGSVDSVGLAKSWNKLEVYFWKKMM